LCTPRAALIKRCALRSAGRYRAPNPFVAFTGGDVPALAPFHALGDATRDAPAQLAIARVLDRRWHLYYLPDGMDKP
jgi:hypothetical protein